MKKQYPFSLFLFGTFLNLFRRFYLIILCIVLCIIGIWLEPCRYAGLILLLGSFLYAVLEQIQMYKDTNKSSDNPALQQFNNAVLGGGDWKQNVVDIVNDKIEEQNKNKPQ